MSVVNLGEPMTFKPFALAVVCAIAGCRSATGPSAELAGLYALTSVDGRALPTLAPCGAFDVVAKSLTLEPQGGANLTETLRDRTTGQLIYFSAVGHFRATGATVSVEAVGGWSHQDWRGRVGADYARLGTELRLSGLGGACDAAATEVYSRVVDL